MSSPKRRRLSQTSPVLSRSSLPDPQPETLVSVSKDKGKAKAPHDSLAGSDDREQSGDEVQDVEKSGGGLMPADADEDDETPHCAICLSPIANKTVISPCLHGQFCWGCIKAWSDQSRRVSRPPHPTRQLTLTPLASVPALPRQHRSSNPQHPLDKRLSNVPPPPPRLILVLLPRLRPSSSFLW
jgi:hypothetical protein